MNSKMNLEKQIDGVYKNYLRVRNSKCDGTELALRRFYFGLQQGLNPQGWLSLIKLETQAQCILHIDTRQVSISTREEAYPQVTEILNSLFTVDPINYATETTLNWGL